MTVSQIGVRELQSRASHVIRAAEAEGVRYRVSVHGRDTGVEIARVAPQGERAAAGISGSELLASPLYGSPLDPLAAEALMALIESGRDAAGRIGDPA